jgi:hypothetical protein
MRAHCERKYWIFKVFGSGAGLCQSNFTRIDQPHASFFAPTRRWRFIGIANAFPPSTAAFEADAHNLSKSV